MKDCRIVLLAEYDPAFEPHTATERALAQAAHALGISVTATWVSAQAIDDGVVDRSDGLWVAPGSPYADRERTLAAIRFAREHGVPCIGTCGGFQYMVVEYARFVLGFADARAGWEPGSSEPFIAPLACSLVGREMPLTFASKSRIAEIYGANSAIEYYYCGSGVNPVRVHELNRGPLRITGSDPEGEVRVVELPDHPFYIGTLFVPQMRSRPDQPHPLVTAFLTAAAAHGSRSVERRSVNP